MNHNKIIRVGDEVLVAKMGKQTVALIEYYAEGKDRGFLQCMTSVHVSDCCSERYIFVFESDHWAYGSQVVPMIIATEIVPEILT